VHADVQVPPPVADTQGQDPLRTPAAAGLLLQHGLTEANAAQPPAEALPVAVPPPTAPPPSSDATAAQTVSLPLDADEIAMLIKRGKDAFSTGDLAAARLLLRRAAEAGSAEAALALGATFDPLVIRRLGAIGAAPDAAQARQWYQKAVALGSATASQPLAQLEAAAQ
jgi:TPR repeat protein